MSNLQLSCPTIDFDSFKVKSSADERKLVLAIQGQIKKWIADNQNARFAPNSLIVNKLTYYSYRKLKDQNPGLVLRSGWYIYGPCYEGLRRDEENLEKFTFDVLGPAKDVSEEVNAVCNEHIPRYAASEGPYFQSYLSFVYGERQIYPELKDYYSSKLELDCSLGKILYEKQAVDKTGIDRKIVNFERAIANPDYMGFAHLDESIVDEVLSYTNSLSHALSFHSDDGNRRLKDFSLILGAKFLEVQRIFAYPDYSATYEHFDKKQEVRDKKGFQLQGQLKARQVAEMLAHDFEGLM